MGNEERKNHLHENIISTLPSFDERGVSAPLKEFSEVVY